MQKSGAIFRDRDLICKEEVVASDIGSTSPASFIYRPNETKCGGPNAGRYRNTETFVMFGGYKSFSHRTLVS